MPVFIRGVGQPVFKPATSDARIAAAGGHFIIEGIVLEGLPLHMSPTLTRFAFRRSTVRYFSPGFTTSAIAVDGTDIVILGNEVHHNGDPNSPVEVDLVGVFAMPSSSRVWILDNHIHHNGGDAVLIGSNSSPEPWMQEIYVGRNILHEDRENGVDIKRVPVMW